METATITDQSLAPGPLYMDFDGLELTADERELLRHPLIGGVVLFARNFHDREQLRALVDEARRQRSGPLLISVDHEGGRVQRFRDGFSEIPPMRLLGKIYDLQPGTGIALCRSVGWLIATELGGCGIDFSFTPVVDLDVADCPGIGDRALHANCEVIIELAAQLLTGLREGGFAGVIKHFPGHGNVSVDSHHELPIDPRSFAQLDLAPFTELCQLPRVAVMPGHIVCPQVDQHPASLSAHWLQHVLRSQFRFDGPIISDDLHMAAASEYAGPFAAAGMALQAGCDTVLICNDRPAVEHFLDNYRGSAHCSAQIERRLSMRALAPVSSSHNAEQVRATLQSIIEQHGT